MLAFLLNLSWNLCARTIASKKDSLSTDVSIMRKLNDPDKFNGSRYQDSKFMTTPLVQRLTERIDKKLVIVNGVSAGLVLSNSGSTYPAYFRIALSITGHFINKQKQFAKGVNKCPRAAATLVGVSHGRYISDYDLIS